MWSGFKAEGLTRLETLIYVQREHANVGSHVHDDAARFDIDSVRTVRLLDKDFIVEKFRLVFVDFEDLQAIRKDDVMHGRSDLKGAQFSLSSICVMAGGRCSAQESCLNHQ